MMKNIELLNICYKFFNEFITADTLVERLINLDKTALEENDIEEINKLIEGIKTILKNTPNKVDEYVIKKKESMQKIISKLTLISQKNDNVDFINCRLKRLQNDYDKEMDSYERWYKVTDYINNNVYFNECFDSLSDEELLEFIVQNIQAPFPPKLSQQEFERLVKVGIKKDKREWLWRLAFNYENRNMDMDSIIDYFIKMKDGYYLTELISAIGQSLDIDKIIDKINDKDLIKDLEGRKNILSISEEQFQRLINKSKD